MAGYLAGRVPAERVVAAVAEAYYHGRGAERERLRPVIDVIERAAPGVAGLGRAEGDAGFDIRLVERPFPAAAEARLRSAIEGALPALGGVPAPGEPPVGLFSRLLRVVRRVFSASA